MTSRERAEKLADGFGGWTQSAIETVRMAIDAAVAEAVAAEREAIAAALDAQVRDHIAAYVEDGSTHSTMSFCEDYGCSTLENIAESIRARGAK